MIDDHQRRSVAKGLPCKLLVLQNCPALHSFKLIVSNLVRTMRIADNGQVKEFYRMLTVLR
jgi:hypothetical protein